MALSEKENKTYYFSNKLNKYFENNIKLSFISKLNTIIITKEDKVYEFSRNAIDYSLLIFSDKNYIIEQKINESLNDELSNKGIIEFNNSEWHTIARTSDGKLYCWGINYFGVIGNGSNDWPNKRLCKPELNVYLKDKFIIELSCGAEHSLILTIDGEVYGWGGNIQGQIGNGKSGFSEPQLTPYFVNEFNNEKVKSISCGYGHSLALTQNGTVYSWGWNEFGQLGRNTRDKSDSIFPKPIKIKEVIFERISCGQSHSLLLSREGCVYVFGNNKSKELGINTESDVQLIPMKLDNLQNCTEIASHWNECFSSALSSNDIYYIWGYCNQEDGEFINEPKETDFKSFNHIFSHYFDVNYKPLEGKVIKFNDNFIRNKHYVKEFREIMELGKGSYGKVYKVSRSLNEPDSIEYNKVHNFAIKTIELSLNLKDISKELENFSVIKELDNERVAKYYNLWFENNFQNSKNLFILIHMELCDKSLKDIINDMKIDTNLVHNNCLTLFGYCILQQMFIQILEGVHYLHTRSPQIIHRDLKPDNILLKISDSKSEYVIKITDMGLICLHNNEYKETNGSSKQYHTQDIGDLIYAAPEMLDKSDYDTRADIYSLGVILKVLFQINDNRDTSDQSILLLNKYKQLRELCNKMTKEDVSQRPESCEQILKDKHLWTLSEIKLKVKEEHNEFTKKIEEEYKKSYNYKLIELFIPKIYRNSNTFVNRIKNFLFRRDERF